jgi:hypothetical protein
VSQLFSSPSKQAQQAASAEQDIATGEIKQVEAYNDQKQQELRSGIAGLDNPFFAAASQSDPSAFQVNPSATVAYGGPTGGAVPPQGSGMRRTESASSSAPPPLTPPPPPPLPQPPTIPSGPVYETPGAGPQHMFNPAGAAGQIRAQNRANQSLQQQRPPFGTPPGSGPVT